MEPGEGGGFPPVAKAQRLRRLVDYVDSLELPAAKASVLLRQLSWRFVYSRRAQTAPDGVWDVWFVLGGRGSGKTRTGAETLAEWAQMYKKTRWACVAPTFGDCRAVMFEGDSGLLSVIPGCALWGGSVEKAFNSSRLELRLANGSKINGYSSERPGRLRGPQQHGYWVDEPGEFRDRDRLPLDLDSTFSNLILGTRLKASGFRTRGIVTGTPKPVRLLAGTPADPGLLTGISELDVIIQTMSSRDNLANLSPVYRKLVDRLDGTRIGRQELDAELLTDVEGAAWRQSWIVVDSEGADERHYVSIAVGVDPAGSSSAKSDETGIVVAGVDEDGKYWVLEDLSGRFTPGEWAGQVWGAVQRWDADFIVVERNFGADMVADTILRHTDCPDSMIREVRASRGKEVRVQPVAFLYEPREGREPGEFVRHTSHMPELVGQMTTFTGSGKGHDDRVDALVWSLLWLSRFGNEEGEFDIGELLPGGKW